MRIEVWTDVVCPFCYVGKRELANALSDFEHADQVEVVWKAFELDPNASANGQDATQHLMDKYGLSAAQSAAQNDQLATRAAEVGLNFNWRESKVTNTLDAHRLVKLAETQGLGGVATDRVMKAFFTDGSLVSDHEVLTRLGGEIGLQEDRVREVLEGVEFIEEVHRDEQEAAGYGISGVPFFVFEGQWAINGAQPAELFSEALDEVWQEIQRPRLINFAEESVGGGCGCGGCGCGAR